MSTLRVDNFQASDGLSAAFGISGIAKAWVNYNGLTNTILDSFNPSSVTDVLTGNFRNICTNAMANTTWASGGIMAANNASNGITLLSSSIANAASDKTATGAAFEVGTTTAQDAEEISFFMIGDLA